MRNSVVFVTLVLFVSVLFAKELPSYIPICKRSDPKLDQCLLDATAQIQPHLAKGIRELSIPAMDPLIVPMVKLDQGKDAINIKAVLTDLKILGLSTYRFSSFKADFSKGFKLHGFVNIPSIRLDADYMISGRLLVVPVQGRGPFTSNITNCDAEIIITADIAKGKSGDYASPKETTVKLRFGNAMAHLDNLFNGDKLLGGATSQFIKENGKDIVEELKPGIEAVASMIVHEIASNLLRSVPLAQLFPE